jgi:exodeoxyribonuclease VII small subunit
MNAKTDIQSTQDTQQPQPLNFELALNNLESLIEKMASGQLTLEDSLKSFEEGIALLRQCQITLKTAEQKVQILIENNLGNNKADNGNFQTRDFTEEG